MKHPVVAVIPARYQSSRFPGKPLALIAGKTLLQRTFDSVAKCTALDAIVVVTDDVRIYEHARLFGAKVVMTAEECKNGTERIIDAIIRDRELAQYEIYINVQGDEPCIASSSIAQLVDIMQNNPQEYMATAVTALEKEADIFNKGIVKCVKNLADYALYFSRAPLPLSYKHVGIYAFRKHFLLEYGKMSNTPLQQLEDLEQLKVLEHGYQIKTVVVDTPSIHVDYPEDIQKVEQWLKQNSFS